MAYMNQDRKAFIAAELKKVVPEGWKFTLAVRNHSTIVFTLKQAPVDILGNIRETIAAKSFGNQNSEVKDYWPVNEYYLSGQFSGAVLEVFEKIKAALNVGNWDNSDPQTDYFDVGWYVDMNVGKWNDPFLDTVPVAQRVAKPKVASASKPAPQAYAQYLPPDWSTLSPGRKAAATKKAMSLLSQFGI